MYESFGEFILALHSLNKEAARWLASACIRSEEGEDTLVRYRNPITNWDPYHNLYSLLIWSNTPQGNEFWRELHHTMIVKKFKED